MEFDFMSAAVNPKKPGHYLTISNMNWYHGGCFDADTDTGLSLSYRVAYWNGGWNDPFVAMWCELPEFPEDCKYNNRVLLDARQKNIKTVYGTECKLV